MARQFERHQKPISLFVGWFTRFFGSKADIRAEKFCPLYPQKMG